MALQMSRSHDSTQPPPYSCLSVSLQRFNCQKQQTTSPVNSPLFFMFIHHLCGSLSACRATLWLLVEGFLNLVVSVKTLQIYSVRKKPAAPLPSPTEFTLMMTTTCLLVRTLFFLSTSTRCLLVRKHSKVIYFKLPSC